MKERKPSRPAGERTPRTTPIGPAEMLRLARQYGAAGRLREADALFQRVLSIHPRDPHALHGRGLIAARLGRMEEAIHLLRKAVAARHDLTEARVDLARTLQNAGRLDEALSAARRATVSSPSSASAHLILGELLSERGEAADALAAHARAVELAPENDEPLFRLGLAYHQLCRHEEAVAALEEAIAHAPKRAELHYSLGTVLHGLKRLDAALAAYDRALDLRPSLSDNLFELGKPRHIHALLEQKDFTGALNRIDLFLQQRPGQSCALALKAVVLDELGERDKVRELVDYRRLIQAVQLNDGPEQGTIGELNDALAKHIKQHPTLQDAPAAFSTHRGKTTGELLRPPFGPVRDFEKLIRRAVEDYAARLPADSSHPFILNRPKSWTMTMWANILESEGFQVPHIHPSGWLSGVYYVHVPEVVRTDGQAGWIEFGEPYEDIAHSIRPETLARQPENGLVLMFPSYFYHRTLPFHSTEQRISIAFDVVPKR